MEVCFLASGETVAVLDAEERSARTLKQTLAARLGVSRFRQRLFLEGDSREISDDEVFASVPAKVQLVVLEFLPPDAEQDKAMIKACSEYDPQALNQLLQYPRNPNVEDERGRTPLSVAAARGHIESVELLLEAGVAGVELLIKAAELGDLELAKLLLEAGVAPNQTRGDAATPLLVAAEHAHVLARLLLRAVTETDHAGKQTGSRRGRGQRATPDRARTDGATPLFVAAEKGHVEIASLLLEAGAAPDHARTDGATPLLVAAAKGHAAVAKLLLEAGAASDQARTDGAAPLLFVAEEGHVGGGRFEAGTPLFVAAEKGHVRVAKLLLEAGAAPDQTGTDGTTPLFVAAEKGHVDVAKLLLEAGVAADQARTDGATPLFVAADEGHVRVVRLLLEAGAAPDLAMNGTPPLLVAVRMGRADCVRLLLDSGAFPDPAKNDHETPLFIAAAQGRVDIVRFLLEAGAASDQVRKDGATPLFIAAREGHVKIAELLLETGASVDVARDFASGKGNVQAVACLERLAAGTG